MKQYKVRVTRQALNHLRSIKSYIAIELAVPEVAQKVLETLWLEMKKLSEMPERIKIIEEEPWKSLEIRRQIVNNFYVYFWISEEKKQVQIIAVIYSKMDQDKQLKNLSFKM